MCLAVAKVGIFPIDVHVSEQRRDECKNFQVWRTCITKRVKMYFHLFKSYLKLLSQSEPHENYLSVNFHFHAEIYEKNKISGDIWNFVFFYEGRYIEEIGMRLPMFRFYKITNSYTIEQ